MTDTMSGALAGALLGAVLGVLGTYLLDVRKAQRERAARDSEALRDQRLRRQTTATCLLQDLRRLEFELRQVYDDRQPTRIALVRPPLFYDAMRADIRFFASESVQPIAEFFRRVDHLYATTALLRQVSHGTIPQTPQREYEFRTHAAFALQQLPKALAALRNEGGSLPGPVEWEAFTYPTLPPIPPPSFDDTVARITANAATQGIDGGA